MKRPVPVLIPFLVFVSIVFIGILIFAYVETRKAHPQMIDVGQAGDRRAAWTPVQASAGRPRASNGRAPLGRRLPACPTNA
jgi:hypothetical protein